MFPRQPTFDRPFLKKMENPYLKLRKITFLSVTFKLLTYVSVPSLVLITFRLVFGAFLKFWRNPEIQDG